MKKIMFSDKYGLTEAVLSGRKTQTRRIILNCSGIRLSPFCKSGIEDNHGYELKPRFSVGEVVVVAQSYKDAGYNPDKPLQDADGVGFYREAKLARGWNNKMFVQSALMPHQIRITNVRVERLNDISESDCRAEGIISNIDPMTNLTHYMFPNWDGDYISNRGAYAALIDRISGKGTWESNPYVFVYEFELVK